MCIYPLAFNGIASTKFDGFNINVENNVKVTLMKTCTSSHTQFNKRKELKIVPENLYTFKQGQASEQS